jgi:hypothetical protein
VRMNRFCLLLILLLGSVGCSARPSGATQQGRIVNFTNCQLPADQGKGSYQGAWASIPIPVVFDKDFYVADNGEAVSAMRGAVGTWNTWARLKNMVAFNLLNDGSGVTAGRAIPSLTDCSQASYSSAVTDAVGVWKISTHDDHANRRDSCGSQGKILPDGVQGQTDWIVINGKIVGSSILLNFEGFNAPGKQRIDVESLLLHELGHVLGLLHSCNGSSEDSTDGTTSPSCDTARKQYTDAVMFPFLLPGVVRRDLEQNDYARINCIY